MQQNEAKFGKFPWKRVLGTSVRLNIFSTIQLINKKFGSNIDWHMKGNYEKNEACSFINFEVIIENFPWKAIKDHISVTKGSITSKNFGLIALLYPLFSLMILVQNFMLIKVAATDIWYFGIWCESLVEATVQSFRLLFLTETDLKSLLRYYEKLRQWNKQTVAENYRSVLHNNHEIM